MTIQRRRVQVKAARTYKKWDNWTEGDYIIGEYTDKTVDNYGKNNYAIKLIEVHMVNPTDDRGGELKAGMTLGLNHCGSLGYRMDDIEVGTEVEIVYNGTTSLPDNHKFKGKACHQVEVFVSVPDEELASDDL